MIKLYMILTDMIFPYYFGVVVNFPSKIVVGTSLVYKNIKAMLPNRELVYPIESPPRTLLTYKECQVLAIQPQSL